MDTLDTPASVGVSDNAAAKSELLCFITDKSRLLPLDDLVKVCADFYREEEIIVLGTLLKGLATDCQSVRAATN